MERRVPETERDIILQLAEGLLPSPTSFMGSEFFLIRFTGTGVRFRSQYSEFVYRPPDLWKNLLPRCTSIPVVVNHPPSGQLDTKEFRERIIGVTVHAFWVEDEQAVWAVMRCLDHDATVELINGEYDSSPAVVFDGGDNVVFDLDGSRFLVEAEPTLIDHLAICRSGVWGSAPGDSKGVEITEAQAA
jgi:hypothetical protein